MTEFTHDLCILGTGRIGLPLGLTLAEAGLRVVGVDPNPVLRAALERGQAPFLLPGYEELLARKMMRVEGQAQVAAKSRWIVIAVGTPLAPDGSADHAILQRVLSELRPHLRRGQGLFLRSTVKPGTTRNIAKWLKTQCNLEVGRDIALAFCPERIAEGKAREELGVIPQIVGSEDELSRREAEALFKHLGCELLFEDWISAELAKVFSNLSRWVNFALGNELASIAEELGSDIHRIRRIANHRYPRQKLPSPGLTGGPCLYKDAQLALNAVSEAPLIQAANQVHQSSPAKLVEGLSQRLKMKGAHVAILGWSFKKDSDDHRDSLAPVLHQLIQNTSPASLRVCDPHQPPVLPVELHPNLLAPLSTPPFTAPGVDSSTGFSTGSSRDCSTDSPTDSSTGSSTDSSTDSLRDSSTDSSAGSASESPTALPASSTKRIENWELQACLKDADAVLVATNHSAFGPAVAQLKTSQPHTWIVDPLNATQSGRLYLQARELK